MNPPRTEPEDGASRVLLGMRSGNVELNRASVSPIAGKSEKPIEGLRN